MAEHLWMPEAIDRAGVAWGSCSCGWGRTGMYQKQKSAWVRHREIHARRLRARS